MALLTAAIPAAISAGGSIISGLSGSSAQKKANETNLKIAREANVANQQLQDRQNSYNYEQWQRENDYNSATNQRKRLEAAGMNPFLQGNAIAQGSAQSSQLRSANYTPTQTSTVQPANDLSGLAGVGNAANDFVSTFNNMRMADATINKTNADADVSAATAARIRGYGPDLDMSNIEKNKASAELARTQSQLNELQHTQNVIYGGAERTAQINNIVSQALNNQSHKIVNEKQAENIVAQTISEYLKSEKIKVETNQLRQLTSAMVQSLKLKNEAQSLQNDITSVEAGYQRDFGRAEKTIGFQQKSAEKSIKQKDDQYYWFKNIGQSFQGIGNVLKIKTK